jgi:hypothetical protein
METSVGPCVQLSTMVDQCYGESADKCDCHIAKFIVIAGPSVFLYTVPMVGWVLAPMWSGFVMSIDNLC